ncbi:hypothetical protein [Pseudosporangium ferrugineum]|uniref:Uncharacterized protein n=1 Tax=Pseudosporangium ferrugineum TaxID=439699 RepID=A0A2T0S5Q2_9ACTN|nr:hypothetical protein [Pseudosporangium ferrugineum]PRY28758.1 hypothetical protein CLV70_10761 [Pseudosporangium ferrugineum]
MPTGAGLVGGSKIDVGVGTGGIVRVGSGDPLPDADGTPELGATPAGRLGGTDSTTDTGFGARGVQPVAEPDADVAGVATGAVPKPPAPAGALTAGGVVPGVPSAHPAATANGRPARTMPKKIDLGESRTP